MWVHGCAWVAASVMLICTNKLILQSTGAYPFTMVTIHFGALAYCILLGYGMKAPLSYGTCFPNPRIKAKL